MIFSRLCQWREPFILRRSLSIYSPAYLNLVKADLKSVLRPSVFRPSVLCRLEGNRTFASIRRPQASKNLKAEQQLAVSRPRLMKEYDALRKKDNMSADWELIFSSKAFDWKILAGHWTSFVCLAALPFIFVLNWWELEFEDNVIAATIEISRRTEFVLFTLMNGLLMAVVFKNTRCIPRRIYFNNETGDYFAYCRSLFPWSTVKMQYKATDVRPLPFRIVAPQLKLFKNSEFFVRNRRVIFPHMAFRSGHDRQHMLRYVE